jgi:hypothetical protein
LVTLDLQQSAFVLLLVLVAGFLAVPWFAGRRRASMTETAAFATTLEQAPSSWQKGTGG